MTGQMLGGQLPGATPVGSRLWLLLREKALPTGAAPGIGAQGRESPTPMRRCVACWTGWDDQPIGIARRVCTAASWAADWPVSLTLKDGSTRAPFTFLKPVCKGM